MAVGLWETALVMHARRAGASLTDFLMLGRQSLALTPAMLEHLFACYGADLRGIDWNAKTWAEPLFEQLGAQRVESLDFSDYEGARLIHDMNRPWPEGHPPEQFDVVFDGGTLEHVFNLPQALLNAMDLVKPGGCLLSVTPADGWLSHGFYQPQPELFFRFLTPKNGFRIEGLWLAEFGPSPAKSRLFHIKDPAVSGCRPLVPGHRPLVMLVHATKLAERSGSPVWPGQSNYTAMWSAAAQDSQTQQRGSLLKRLLKAVVPGFIAHPLKRWRQHRRHARLARNSWQEVPQLQSTTSSST
jgi:SAM-dependent methyltransferase